MTTTTRIAATQAHQIAIIGREFDEEDGDDVFLCRKSRQISHKDLERFALFAMMHEVELTELLDDHGALIVHFEDCEDWATVYLVPRGVDVDDLSGSPRCRYPSVEMSMM